LRFSSEGIVFEMTGRRFCACLAKATLAFDSLSALILALEDSIGCPRLNIG
jgi:hypothetical protein